MENKRPTKEELTNYFFTKRKYFDELATYYYTNDIEYYSTCIAPIYENNKFDGLIDCPFCHSRIKPNYWKSMSTGGIFMILAGILLAPVLVGIILIIIGMNMKDVSRVCPMCKMKF